ncbi:DUF4199 domain-containing protein [Hymenobacter aerilatus]|uniref:DUF4199 domain-containing protein n=1 Tax=Hymenobacter aerilatus TaxID=2932251 RepID=A0A8T9T1R6_9BACT|nr:DUF4199 domain-containing protein [Hymenobacter aerilatus]UOR06036.1 DUF4199 domain-containing protein [Hymenobacter aerilatus]
MENTSTSSVTTTSVGVRYGILTGIASVIISLVLYATNLEQSPVRWISMLVLAGGIVLAHQLFKQHNNGFMSYGQGLGIGAVVGAVSGLISGVYTFIYSQFINPDFLSIALNKARADMEARGNLSDEQIEQGLQMSAKFMDGPFLYIGAILGTLFFAFLFALVISAFTKHKRPEFE